MRDSLREDPMNRTLAFSALQAWQLRCVGAALLLVMGGSELAKASPSEAAAPGTAPIGVDSGMAHDATRPEPLQALGVNPGWIQVPPCQVSEDARAGRIDLTTRR